MTPYGTLCHPMPPYDTLWHPMSPYVILCHPMSLYVTLPSMPTFGKEPADTLPSEVSLELPLACLCSAGTSGK